LFALRPHVRGDGFAGVGDSFALFVEVVDVEGGLDVGAMGTAHLLLLLGDPVGDVVAPAAFSMKALKMKISASSGWRPF